MGGYAAGFVLATWIFANPALEYLACLALSGAAVAGTTYLGDLAAGARSLAMAGVGLVLWIAFRVLAAMKLPTAYHDPVVRSARAVAAVTLVLSAWAVGPWGQPS